MKPYISVIFPTMRIGGLDVVFNSLENQTFKNFELIIVDSLYQYRKDIVKEQCKKFSFKYKHLPPIEDNFPTQSYCHAMNTAITNVNGEVILFTSDYRYLMPDSLQKHADFHKISPDNLGYAPPSISVLPPTLKSGLPSYGFNQNYDKYVEDLKSNKLNDFMWSIFDNNFFNTPRNPSTWEQMDWAKYGHDTKINMTKGTEVSPLYIYLQTESIKTKLVLEANGLNEELDGGHSYQDIEFTHRLRNLFNFKWIADNTNPSYRIDGGHKIIDKMKLLENVENNSKNIFKKYENGSKDPINNWNLIEKYKLNKENKMKIAIILGEMSVGNRPLDFHFNNIFDSSRGLTGTDLSYVMIAKELQKLGHDIHLFTIHAQPDNKPDIWNGCKLYNYDDRNTIIDETFDIALSLNEPNVFLNINTKPVRMVWQFLNDFTYCFIGINNYIDHWIAVCEDHKDHLSHQKGFPNESNWDIIPLGCDPSWYEDKRVYGRVVWTSSADRGLHNLLEMWPRIKLAVPEATLKIFYHFEYGSLFNIEPDDKLTNVDTVEMANRLRYIVETVKRLKPLGVEHCKSISRNQMAKELSEASVFAFPCDTVAKTEGYSISTLEGHASNTVVVMTDQDCLGSIYKDSGCIMFESPVRNKLEDFSDAVIKGLTDKQFADNIIEKCMDFASKRTWSKIAGQLEEVMLNHPKYKERLNEK